MDTTLATEDRDHLVVAAYSKDPRNIPVRHLLTELMAARLMNAQALLQQLQGEMKKRGRYSRAQSRVTAASVDDRLKFLGEALRAMVTYHRQEESQPARLPGRTALRTTRPPTGPARDSDPVVIDQGELDLRSRQPDRSRRTTAPATKRTTSSTSPGRRTTKGTP